MNQRLYREIVERKPYLFWSVGDKKKLSEELVVETVLNYGDFDDVLNLFDVLGIKRVAEIFYSQREQMRNNYKKQTDHFFNLYFRKRVLRSS